MFKIDEYVIHSRDGLCRITNVEPIDVMGDGEERDYFILVPVNNPKSRIYVPVNTADNLIRKPLSHEKALEIIDALPEIDELQIENEKTREQLYSAAMLKNDCVQLFKLIKTTYSRNMARRAKGHTATAVDESYFKAASRALYSELAFALDIDSKEIVDFIKDRIDGDVIPVPDNL
ncbi:MAG: CarD family transcriptional regulator [Lachnospiraceae bacterium]|nr:CarD family transcriptional regulator [Lachnospiraceae bacterium]